MGLVPALVVACGVALSVAGCGGAGEPATTSRATPTEAAAPATQSTAPTETSGRTTPARRGPLRLVQVASVDSPTALAAPPGDPRRVFVTEQGGRIRVIRGGKLVDRPVLDLSQQITAGGEQGLLGIAFAPDYARSRRFYVDYTNRQGDTRIVEFRMRASDPDVADPATAREVLGAPGLEPNHNGGQLAFGPDRLLYIGTGDGGGGNDQHGARGNAQDLGSLLGKILRIDPRPSGGRPYRIPASNPFVGRAGARGEVYSSGLRNPWRFSFDRATGDLAIADVGQDAIEEVDFVRRGRGRGANFGWRPFEGDSRIFPGEQAPGHVRPVIQKTHADGWCSITGGFVVRDPGLPALRGRYVYADFCKSGVRAARLTPSRAVGDRALDLSVSGVSSFGEDAAGRVYVLSLEGPVLRLTQG